MFNQKKNFVCSGSSNFKLLKISALGNILNLSKMSVSGVMLMKGKTKNPFTIAK
jgi:hypothetical protein